MSNQNGQINKNNEQSDCTKNDSSELEEVNECTVKNSLDEPKSKNGGVEINIEGCEGVKTDTNKEFVYDKKNGENLLGVPRTGHRKSIMEEESAKERLRVCLLKQCSAILKQGGERFTREGLHKTLQDEDLLERIFRLFDLDQQNHLVQEDWLEFLKGRLVDERQLDFAEQVESLAYVLCGDGVVTAEHFQTIFKSKSVSNRLFRVVDTDGDGVASADDVMDFLAVVTSSRSRVGGDQVNVHRLEQLFKDTVGDQKEITREQFEKIVVSKNPFFTERVFQIFDEDDSGAISLHEFITAAHSFAGQTAEQKIKFLFKVYDLDGDGLIQPRELQHVLRACMEENGMQFSARQLGDLTSAMFEDAGCEARGEMTYEALKSLLEKQPALLRHLTTSIDRWLIPPEPQQKPTFFQKVKSLRPYQFSQQYIKNNQVLVWYLLVYALVNIVLFVSRVIEYRDSNGYVMVARGCGQCLNFNCTWVVVLMLRRALTRARARGWAHLLPIDHHVYLHKVTGVVIGVFSVIHTIMHLCNFSLIVVHDPVINAKNYTLHEWLLTERPGMFGLVGGCANPTGVALAAVAAIVYYCSLPRLRRQGNFEVFYWTHLLYVPFWLLLVFHAPNFWKWFVVPGGIYIIERVMRLTWMRSERGKTYISSGVLLPSRVTHLVVRRPPQLDFRAGDYVFVNIPAIARAEWHPFTISSAPEQLEHIWLHIRGVGEWTNKLHDYFERQHADLAARTGAVEHDNLSRKASNLSTKSKKSVDFSPNLQYSPSGFSNQAFCFDEEPRALSASPKPKLLLSIPKNPLEKSLSMPNINKGIKKDALRIMRSYARSESERHFEFEELELEPRATPSVGRQNKELMHSFRYMRNKPTIIAFKTPSLEGNEKVGLINAARRRLSKTLSPDKNSDAESCSAAATTQEDENLHAGKPLVIYLDGPYGAPSSHIFRAEHAALVAAGIGVTPFASILQSVMRRYWQCRVQCPSCRHCWAGDIATTGMSLRKVDFFWINREQRSFEWFVQLLSQLEMEQAELSRAGAERFLDMHLYITSALQRSDMKAVALQLALDLLHQKEKRDLITGLKTRTNAGRPNWDKVFKQLQEQNKGRVSVFYCGPPQLAKILRVKCDQFGFEFRKEVF